MDFDNIGNVGLPVVNTEEIFRGKVVSYNSFKGSGFIRPDTDSFAKLQREVFVSYCEVDKGTDSFKSLIIGDVVSFQVEMKVVKDKYGRNKETWYAKNVYIDRSI